MSVRRMSDILSMMIAGGDVAALPARATWPVHRALLWLSDEATRRSVDLGLKILSEPDPDVCLAAVGAEEALSLLLDDGLLTGQGSGYTALWHVEGSFATYSRRAMLREEPATVRLICQAGQRLATAASTALKNADTAAASWASMVTGPSPTVRQPPLVALR